MSKTFFTHAGYYNREYSGYGVDVDDIIIPFDKIVHSTEKAIKIKRSDNIEVWVPKSLCYNLLLYDDDGDEDGVYVSGFAVRKFGLHLKEEIREFKPKYILRKKCK